MAMAEGLGCGPRLNGGNGTLSPIVTQCDSDGGGHNG